MPGTWRVEPDSIGAVLSRALDLGSFFRRTQAQGTDKNVGPGMELDLKQALPDSKGRNMIVRSTLRLVSLSVFLAQASLHAQCPVAPIAATLGAGSPGTSGAAQLKASLPAVGGAWSMAVAQARPHAPAWLLVSAKKAPVALRAFDATLWPATPTHIFPFVVDGNGEAKGLFALPKVSAALCGFEFVSQAVVLDPKAKGSFAFTNGVRIRFGDGPALWANDGGDKVTRDETRMTRIPSAVTNSIWDGETIRLFAARNEVVSFNLVVEAPSSSLSAVGVRFDKLVGPGAYVIGSRTASGNGIFDFRGRDIELFVIRYLRILGLSKLSYETYDERHIPKRLRRPWSGEGFGKGRWTDRPDHDKEYPEIAMPIEVVGRFPIAAKTNQSVWADIWVPPDAKPGTYRGQVEVQVGTNTVRTIPVELDVRGFSLPDRPSCKTMLVLGYADVNRRHTGRRYPDANSKEARISAVVRDNYFKVAHRHRVTVVDSNVGPKVWIGKDQPRDHWLGKLNGTFYTPANGYAGPGTGVGQDLFAIGLYGSWEWKNEGQAGMHKHLNAWQAWFDRNKLTNVERFLYVEDEPDLADATTLARLRTWLGWMNSNPGRGRTIRSFLTVDMPKAQKLLPTLDTAASWIGVGQPKLWDPALTYFQQRRRHAWCYNGVRPATGSFATEDDGVALRSLAWAQWKRGIDRWFFWASTYWNNYQGGAGETNVFRQAMTYGGKNVTKDPVVGETSWNYSNGDGVLFYPGSDKVYPAESKHLDGPIVSLRLKHWRRGIQDHQYLTMAAAKNPTRVRALVQSMIPKVLWEYGVADPTDPTWQRTDISWPVDPDRWEAARRELADIIAK